MGLQLLGFFSLLFTTSIHRRFQEAHDAFEHLALNSDTAIVGSDVLHCIKQGWRMARFYDDRFISSDRSRQESRGVTAIVFDSEPRVLDEMEEYVQ